MTGNAKGWHWLTWVAGVILLWALIYQNIIVAYHPSVFIDGQWSIGWPASFLRQTPIDANFDWSRLLVDIAFAVIVIAATMTTVDRWSSGRVGRPPINLKTLVVLIVTVAGWWLLLVTLQVPTAVFFGWAAKMIVFLATPCVAYAFVTALSRARPRYNLKVMFVAVTCVCVVVAILGGRNNSFTQPPLLHSVGFGILEQLDVKSETGQVVGQDFRVAKETRVIPCTLGTLFGVRYTLANDSVVGTPGERIEVTKIWHYPRERKNLRTGVVSRQTKLDTNVAIGVEEWDTFWLGNESFLIPGTWRYELWYRDRKLLEQEFELRAE